MQYMHYICNNIPNFYLSQTSIFNECGTIPDGLRILSQANLVTQAVSQCLYSLYGIRQMHCARRAYTNLGYI